MNVQRGQGPLDIKIMMGQKSDQRAHTLVFWCHGLIILQFQDDSNQYTQRYSKVPWGHNCPLALHVHGSWRGVQFWGLSKTHYRLVIRLTRIPPIFSQIFLLLWSIDWLIHRSIHWFAPAKSSMKTTFPYVLEHKVDICYWSIII